MDRGFAPAKVNLALHVTGRREDGYHALDSLVAFAAIGDQLSAIPARDLSLAVSGPFAEGVPTGEDNLVLRAARALRAARGVDRGAQIRLVKNLPHAAGIGGGSSDAAAAIRLLAQLWGVEPFAPEAPEALALGSDVPVCLLAPAPARLRGTGGAVAPADLPPLGLVLVNPGTALPTRDVFAALASPANPALPEPPAGASPEAFAAYLGSCRNDLEAPARALAPAVAEALAALGRAPGVLLARMSGSGATCFGLTRDAGHARVAARLLQIAHPRWWVAPAALLGAPPAPRAAAAGVAAQ